MHQAGSHGLQTRLSSTFRHKILQKERCSNDKLIVVHPEAAEVHSGQLLLIKVPTEMGQPTAVSMGALTELLPEQAVCVHDSSVEAELTKYVICMVLLPQDCASVEAQLGITFVDGRTLSTGRTFRLRG